MTNHPQVFIAKHNITCDAEIAELIEALNDYGFKTAYSCQGEANSRAYIMFAPDTFFNIDSVLGIFVDIPNTICEVTKWVEPNRYTLTVRQNRTHFDEYADRKKWIKEFIKHIKQYDMHKKNSQF